MIQCLLIEPDKKLAQKFLDIIQKRDTQDLELKWVTDLWKGQRQLMAGDIDVVIVNLFLPDIHGEEIVKKLRAYDPQVPIIFLCDAEDLNEATRAIKAGAQDHFIKTDMDPLRLIGMIRRHVEQKKVLQQLSLFQRFAESAGYGFLIATKSGDITYLNVALAKLLKAAAPEKLYGQNIAKLYPPDVRKYLADKVFPEIFSKGQWAGQLQLLSPDGSITQTLQNILAVRDEQGELLCYGNMIIDVTDLKRAQEALNASEKKFMDVFYASNDAIFIYRDGRFSECNAAAVKMFKAASSSELLSRNGEDFFPDKQPDGRSSYREWMELQQTAFDQGSLRLEWICRRADGGNFPTEMTLTQILLGQQVLYVVVKDISEKKKAEENLHMLSLAVEQSPAAVMITDPQGNIEYVNRRFLEVSEYMFNEVVGRNPRFLKSQHTPVEKYQELWTTILSGQDWHGEFYNKKKNGDLFWEHASISPIKNSQGQITHFLAVKEDMTAYKEYEKKLIRQANYDNLTNLPNRALALDRISQSLARAHRNGSKVGILFIDLDRFKMVNDTLGHEKGDLVLVEAARRFSTVIRESDTVARLGGDEFLVIIPDLVDTKNVSLVAARIRDAFAKPFMVDDHEMLITASIGITAYPTDGDDAHVLLRNADVAMYKAKEEERNTFRFFTKEMNLEAMRRMEMEAQLRHAIEKKELFILYQPILDMKSRVIGSEALLRWKNPALGLVLPEQFIPLSEETGLIVPIGAWVLENATLQAAQWQKQSGRPLIISVNVSSRQFRGKDLYRMVMAAVAQSQISPASLELEITEGLVMDKSLSAGEVIKQFHQAGIRLSIDDFGTGYSSLSYLKKYPLNTLKIDRSFIRDLTKDATNAALCTAMIGMSQGLGLTVVAEGVESVEQFEFLRAKGCNCFQGFYFSKPILPEEFYQYFISH
ncbi:MAG: EAL domain-containing protein [Candidatus Omnitrophica bacterium]|nr:EAL domain-containing protein [Candidatus Omnitrophota bacterium]